MDQHRFGTGPLLNEQGNLCEPGYANALLKTYDRSAIRAPRMRIKEWDYYLITNDRYGIALTIDDNGYMGLLSASVLDFENAAERTVSPMFWFPMGKTGFPSSSASGDVRKTLAGVVVYAEGQSDAAGAQVADTHKKIEDVAAALVENNNFPGGGSSGGLVATEDVAQSSLLALTDAEIVFGFLLFVSEGITRLHSGCERGKKKGGEKKERFGKNQSLTEQFEL